MAEDLPRLQASRKAYKAHITRLYHKIDASLDSEVDEYTVTTLRTAIEQLNGKKTKIVELHERIAALITDPNELTEAMIDAGDLEDSITDKIAKALRYIELQTEVELLQPTPSSQSNAISQPSAVTEPPQLLSSPVHPTSIVSTQALETSSDLTPQDTISLISSNPIPSIVSLAPMPTASTVTAAPLISAPLSSHRTVTSSTSLVSHASVPQLTPTIPEPASHVYTSSQSLNSRLPKLTLPVFSGDPLNWQTFWDSFNAAVHTNPALGSIQKFNYLKAQLQGDAARAIAGLPLTERNYQHSIELLENRFGQPHKLINAHMQALLDMPNPNTSLTSLRLFYDTIATHTRALGSLGKSKEVYGDLLVSVILKKLPVEVRRNLAREQTSTEWRFDDLTAAILKEIRVLEAEYQVTDSQRSTASFHVGFKNNSNTPTPKRNPVCAFCKGPHPSHSCTTFTEYQARIDLVKRENLCFNCLGHHKVSRCTSKFRCKKCKKRHHTSLCDSEPPKPDEGRSANHSGAPTGVPTVPITTTANLHTSTSESNHPHNSTTCLLKTAVAPVIAGHIREQANILFDEGAQRSFISAEMAARLCLQPTTTQGMALASFGANTASYQELGAVTVEIETITGDRIPMSVLVIPSIAAPIQSSINTSVRNMPYLQGLKLAHPVTSDHKFEISLLIGTDYYWSFIQDHIVRGQGPTAQQSKLGYLLSGPVPSSSQEASSSILLQLTSTAPCKPDLEPFWSIEAIGTTVNKSADLSFLKTYQETCIHQSPGGMYVAKFPWKESRPCLPSNYAICLKRTNNNLNRLRQNPEILKLYDGIIQDQEKRGFIERVSDHPTNNVHYLPHRHVRKDSITTPIRIVYDCSCRESASSVSLNDCLQIGPPFLNNLCAILIRFRDHHYALSTDIEKAFLHVQLHDDDRNFTRFLWPTHPEKPDSKLQVYRFAVVPFGSCSSPFMLAAVLNLHLSKTSSPVANDMKQNIYVDNILSGCDTEAEIMQYYTQSREIMGKAKFNLRSWSSNNRTLQRLVDEEKTGDPNTTVGILGLCWNTKTDMLSLTPKQLPTNMALLTKRDVLQTSSLIYDPLGWATPVTIKAKILLQYIWQSKLSWDEPLPNEINESWVSILADLIELPKLAVPRPYFRQSHDACNMFVFSDASMKAYGAVVYLCHQDQVSLVMSKNRVAPTKAITLPKLELMAAVMATRLANFVKSSLHNYDLSTTTHLWTDSQIVLYWIYKQTSTKPFIQQRITEIVESFPPTKWSFTPTSDNPADLLTRGISTQQLLTSQLWSQGPTWLLSESKWPKWLPTGILHINIAEAEEEIEQTTTPEEDTSHITGISNIVTITCYSSINKLLAVTAYVLRFIHNLSKQHTRLTGPLSVSELQSARKLWISSSQHSCFKDELSYLLKRNQHHCPTLVKQLRLFLDKSNLIRCGGRIHNAPVSEMAKFPYLLPPRHTLTNMIIQQTHKKLNHAGVNVTVTALRQVFWIPTIRQRVKTQLRQCVVCNRLMGKPYQAPDPPPLPRVRVQASQPFSITGVDFTGALYVRDSTGERKVYICLFTCACTRAVHLELVCDLSVDSFLLAFRRFVSRKSLPTQMISDNASTYLAAAEEIKELFESDHLREVLERQHVKWSFIPKRAPWYGGFWERLVGLTKQAVKKTLGRTFVTLQTLETVVVEIEGMLNDRPLTYVSSDISDPEPLTPAHLIYGRRIVSVPHPVEDPDEDADPSYLSDQDMRKATSRHSKLIQQFWVRWRREYLTALREFHKTTGNNRQVIKRGDVVVVHDDTPRLHWKLAVVDDLVKGNDGLIRSAHISTANHKTSRPITRLYPLEVVSSENGESANHEPSPVSSDSKIRPRSKRAAATKAMDRIAEWTDTLCCPPGEM